jgi:hypothetical protein
MCRGDWDGLEKDYFGILINSIKKLTYYNFSWEIHP